jgi:hypothetical protein
MNARRSANIIRKQPPRASHGAVEDDVPGVLRAALSPGEPLAIWRRSIPAGIRGELASLAGSAPFAATAEGSPRDATASVIGELFPDAPRALARDILDLATMFADLAGTGGAVRVRLEAITGPACRRWHADAVRLRMLCTYLGEGTEWLPLPRGALPAGALDPAALPCAASRLPAGAVAVMKGEGFGAGAGCVHRSPPTARPGAPRLLLCVDEPGRLPACKREARARPGPA